MFPLDIEGLQRAIGYTFNNKSILVEALTHSSYANELRARKQSVKCNERLEFLGDSVLSIIVSEYLYSLHGELAEGELTKLRAAVVQSSALASYAKKIGLGDYLYLGNGEEKNCGRERQSILENAFEALLAAVYLDAGEKGKETVCVKIYLGDFDFETNLDINKTAEKKADELADEYAKKLAEEKGYTGRRLESNRQRYYDKIRTELLNEEIENKYRSLLDETGLTDYTFEKGVLYAKVYIKFVKASVTYQQLEKLCDLQVIKYIGYDYDM